MKQDKAVFWWASPSFHWRFRSFYLALLVPMSRNFRHLESRARIFRSISGSEMIKTLYSLGLKFWNQGVAVSNSPFYYLSIGRADSHTAKATVCTGTTTARRTLSEHAAILFFWNMTAGAFHLENVSSVRPTGKFHEKAENL